MDYSPESTAVEGAEGVAIVAGDGRAWRFRGPHLRYRPRSVQVIEPPLVHSRIELEITLALPLEVERPLEAARAAARADDFARLVRECIRMAVPMLRACHELTDDQLAEVLTFDEWSIEPFCVAVLNVASGRSPWYNGDDQAGDVAGVDLAGDGEPETIPLADEAPADHDATEPAFQG